MKEKYFIKAKHEQEWTEVSKELYVSAERANGFFPKPGCGPTATASFSGATMQGRTEYVFESENDSTARHK